MTSFIGSNPDQVPLNGMLGNMAFQSKERVNITGGTLSNVTINSPTVPGLVGTVLTNGTLSNTVEAVGTSTYSIASQYDVGTAPNQIPLNQFLGTMAYQDASAVVSPFIAGGNTPTSSLTLQSTTANGTSDSILFKVGNNGATTAMTINTSGRVGVGTTSPAVPLQVGIGGIVNPSYANGRTADNPSIVVGADSALNGIRINSKNYGLASASFLDLFNPESKNGDVTSGYRLLGGVTSGAATSDAYLSFSTIALASGGTITATERMRITNAGNLGIGTTAPAGLLEVFDVLTVPARNTTTIANKRGLSIYNNQSAGFIDTTLVYGNTVNSYLAIGSHDGTSYTERMRIAANGNVGFGISPAVRLHAYSATGGTIARLQTGTTANGNFLDFHNAASARQGIVGFIDSTNLYIHNDAAAAIIFDTSATERMRIHASGGVSINNTTDPGAGNLSVTGSIAATTTIRSSGATSGVGYATGAGGTVTQATDKATGVTLNRVTGQITMNAAALNADTTVTFTLTNSAIAATDILVLNHISGGTAGAYTLNAQAAAGSATINVRNITAGSLSEAIIIAFAVVKAVTA